MEMAVAVEDSFEITSTDNSASDDCFMFEDDMDFTNTDDLGTDNSSISEIVATTRRKRRREPHHAVRKKYLANLFPRIVKHDIRRFYPRMFANVFNSYDGSLVASFLRTYCLPTISTLDSMPTVALLAKPNLPEKVRMKGLDDSILSFLMMIELIPDASFLTHRSQIRQFRNESGRSELDIVLDMCGTKLFDLVLDDENTASYQHQRHSTTHSNDQNTTKDDATQDTTNDDATQESHSEPVLHQVYAYLDATRYLPQTGRQSEHVDLSTVTSLPSSSLPSRSSSSSSLPSMGVQSTEALPVITDSMPCTYMPGMRKVVSSAPFAFSVRCFVRITLDEQHRMVHIDTTYPDADTM